MSALLLDTFLGRVRLEGTLTTATGLHIGAGEGISPIGTDSPVVRNAAGEPFIPGSSLKGVLRSSAESLLRSNPRLRACDQVGGRTENCVDHKKAQSIREKFEQKARAKDAVVDTRGVALRIWEESCSVCRLFGSPALASRVRFPDLPLVGEPPLSEMRNGVGIDRERELAAHGVLYDFEVVPPSTCFKLVVIVDNPTDADVGLLLYLFEQFNEGAMTLGGKSSRGLGQVRIEWDTIVETSLASGNPFSQLVSCHDLYTRSDPRETRDEPAEASSSSLPTPDSGDPDTWKLVQAMIESLEEIDKGKLGVLASEKGLSKGALNQKLDLGLDPKKPRRAWDAALERLLECGFLAKQDDRLLLASRQRPRLAKADDAALGRDAQLQACYDRFAGAAARFWEEGE